MQTRTKVLIGAGVVVTVGLGWWLFRPETAEEAAARIAAGGGTPRTVTIHSFPIILPFPVQREVPAP